MSKSIKINYVFNLLDLLSSFLFPLITFPYASRIILAEGIGQVNFYNSIINYIILATGLGIPMYAVREVARVRDNLALRTKTTCEIIVLNLILNCFGYIAVFIISQTVVEINQNIPLFFLLSLSILLNTIGCSWFYKGIEEFKYITIRGFLVKLLSLPILFFLVRTKNDVFYYGCFLIIASIGNSVVNFITLRKHINIQTISLKALEPFRHLKPALTVFTFYLITSFYLHLDSVMLGFLSGNSSVGFYTAATKVSHMVNQLITSIGTVMLPRLSNLIATNKIEEFKKLATKSYDVISFFCYPIFVGLIVMSPVLIRLLSGDTYEPAIRTLQLISPILIALPISNLIGIQILYPYGQLKLVNITCCIGAFVNFILNCFLIPKYAQNGAAIATVVAEASVTISQCVLARKYIPFKVFTIKNVQYILAAFTMGLGCYYIMNVDCSDIIKLFIVPAVGMIIYGTIALFFNNSLLLNLFKTIRILK